MKVYQFHEYTAGSIHDPDIVAYGVAGWELIAVVPTNDPASKTFYLQRERPDWLTVKSGPERGKS